MHRIGCGAVVIYSHDSGELESHLYTLSNMFPEISTPPTIYNILSDVVA